MAKKKPAGPELYVTGHVFYKHKKFRKLIDKRFEKHKFIEELSLPGAGYGVVIAELPSGDLYIVYASNYKDVFQLNKVVPYDKELPLSWGLLDTNLDQAYIAISRHVHDYCQTLSGECAIDGGFEYLRTMYNNESKNVEQVKVDLVNDKYYDNKGEEYDFIRNETWREKNE